MVNQALLKTKIAHIKKSVEKLSRKAKISLKEFKSDTDAQDIIIHNTMNSCSAFFTMGLFVYIKDRKSLLHMAKQAESVKKI